jgi:uncharacterized protein (DUF2235 family)
METALEAPMKRLVVCCDGTWNRPDQETTDGVPCPTNVTKLAYRVSKRAGDTLQLLFYDQGVGTGNIYDRYVGGAFGEGLTDNIFDAYRFLVANYEPGDEIFLFGFSRGAFTARSVAGMVRKCGILKRESIRQYRAAVNLYQDAHASADVQKTIDFRGAYALEPETRIQCVGVFDTVGALGLPVGGRNDDKYAFHDTELSRSVRYAFQALAVDERRSAFEPTLWSFKAKPGQTIRQVWFPGAHSDVGGGYGEHELSDLALTWMIEQAKEAGLVFDSRTMTENPLGPEQPLGTLHDSLSFKYKLLPRLDRPIGLSKHHDRDAAKDVGTTDVPDDTQSLHRSVLARWDGDKAYRPPQLREYFKRIGDARAARP